QVCSTLKNLRRKSADYGRKGLTSIPLFSPFAPVPFSRFWRGSRSKPSAISTFPASTLRHFHVFNSRTQKAPPFPGFHVKNFLRFCRFGIPWSFVPLSFVVRARAARRGARHFLEPPPMPNVTSTKLPMRNVL